MTFLYFESIPFNRPPSTHIDIISPIPTVTALKTREISTPLYTVVKPYPYLSTSGTIIMLAMTGGRVYTNFFFRRK